MKGLSLLHVIYKLSLWLHGRIFWVIQDATSQREKAKEQKTILVRIDFNIVLD